MANNEYARLARELSRYKQHLGALQAMKQDPALNGQTLESMITDIQGIIYKLEERKRELEREMEL